MTKPTLDQLIASARADEPTPAQLKQLEQKLAPLLPPGGGGHGGGGAAGGGGLAVKLVAVSVVAIGGGVAVQQAVSRRTPAPAPQIAAAPPPILIDAMPDPPEVVADAAPIVEVAPPPPRKQVPRDTLAAEAALLDRARTAIQRGDAAAALAACDVHAKKFAHGTLGEERERIAIEALVALGRRAEAEARAQRFDHAFANSVQSERIHALLRR